MSDTPLLLAIHELNKWLDEQKELKSNLSERDESDMLDREIEVLTGAITICRKFTNHDKPTESEVQ
jgi:hypothetical protein|tara:strand:- start:2697 stop:2894 length:198 start_codon:yes stop_codon:yes gene_type:complete